MSLSNITSTNRRIVVVTIKKGWECIKQKYRKNNWREKFLLLKLALVMRNSKNGRKFNWNTINININKRCLGRRIQPTPNHHHHHYPLTLLFLEIFNKLNIEEYWRGKGRGSRGEERRKSRRRAFFSWTAKVILTLNKITGGRISD